MLRFKGLIFDKDGTLFHFQESWGDWLDEILEVLSDDSIKKKQKMANVLGFNLTRKKFFKESTFIAGTTKEFLSLVEPFSQKLKGKALEKFIDSKLMTLNPKPVGDLRELFFYLKSKEIFIGVATNDNENPCRSQLEDANIIEFFDFIAGSDSGYGFKPETGQLEAFCKSLKLNVKDVAMVGDSTHDLIAAKKAGVHAIGVLTGVAEKRELDPYADIILSSIEDIPNYLN